MAENFFSSPLVKDFLSLIETNLKGYLDSHVKTILDIGNYITEGGGKRLRPLLVLLIAKGGNVEGETLKNKVVPLAVGIEYIHTASLLHDDVVDEAPTRRGKPSAHKVFGNAVAVLTGDYMYANALYLFSRYGNKKMKEVVSEAVKKMAEGQVLELKKVGELIDEETYFQIIDGKNAVLFAAAAAVGALNSPCLSFRWEDFWRFGLHLGRAFQLVDDALDYEGNAKKVGKPTGQDLKEGKTTYPLLSVLDKLGDQKEIKKVLLNGDEQEVSKIVNLVRKLGGVDNTKKRAREELFRAREVLKSNKLNGEVGNLLNSLLDFVVERTY